MAVLQSWYVMVFIFITQFLYRAYGDEKEDKAKCLDTLAELRGLATGYEDPPYDGQSLSNMSVKDLMKILAGSYNQLECGYLFSAQLHMKLTKDAVSENVGVGASPETVKAFSFEEESLMMIETLFYPKHGQINELWLIFVYARQMRVFIEHNTNGGRGLSNDVLKKMKWMNKKILSVINKRIKGWCRPENSFNMDYELCEHWHKQRSKKERVLHINKKVPSPFADDAVLNAIQANKKLLQKNFDRNRKKGLVRQLSASELIRDDYLLLFKKEDGFDLFVGEFLAKDTGRVRVQFPGLGFEWNVSAVKTLGEYQRQIIGTLEIIILKIILSYTNRLIDSGDNPLDTFNVQVLTPYHMLMLEEDTEFVIYDGFLKCYDNIVECKRFLNIEIVEQIKMITKKNNLPEIKPSVIDSGTSLDDVLGLGVKLINKIKDEFGEMRIRLVKSFLEMIDENFSDHRLF